MRSGYADPHFTTFLFKIASRCNLNCLYCYEYNRGDDTWRTQPSRMSLETFKAACNRIREHVIQFDVRNFCIIFHGGEPLLVGPERFQHYLQALNECFSCVPAALHLGLQTNGTLISEEWVEILDKSPIPIGLGISLDGGTSQFNRLRIFHTGESSFAAVLRGIEHLKKGRVIFKNTSFLKVIDPEEEPVEVASSLVRLGVKRCDFLLPLVHWNSRFVSDEAEYQKRIKEYFEKSLDWWWNCEPERSLEIRTFKVWGCHLLGRRQRIDSWGGGPSQIVVIDASGGYQLTDSYKVVSNGFTQLGMNIYDHTLVEVMQNEKVLWIREQASLLPTKCKACEFAFACGGGQLANRFHETDFARESFHYQGIFSGLQKLKSYLEHEASSA
jgi:uncharacterized protein